MKGRIGKLNINMNQVFITLSIYSIQFRILIIKLV